MEDNMDDIFPGPPTILWDNQYHVSNDVWDGGGREELETYCGSQLFRDWQLRRSQRELLHMVGFGVFANRHVVLQTDQRRISALIERWRPETNTFFMKPGEMTVTLEDVGFITGLPVMGEVLTCGAIENRKKFFVENWFEPLTEDDVKAAIYRNQIRLTWLYERYGRIKPAKDDMRALTVCTQAYMLFVIGAVLFPTSSRSLVHPRYIQPLLNLREIRNYAWGAAVLAYLYRGLEFAAKKTSKSVSCCVWLLEIWSFERFPHISVPIRDVEREDYPVAEGWSYSTKIKTGIKRRGRGPHHSLQFYRGEFDGVAGDAVEWLPYTRFDSILDWEMLQFQLAGQARVSLVCYDVVEWQHPERVMRQFGCRPQIPGPPVSMLDYRQPKDATFLCEDWLSRWFVDIGRWVRFCEKFDGIVDDENSVSEEEYMAWYVEIARTRLRKPEPILQENYSTREIIPGLESYKCILAGLDMLKRLDAIMPAELVEQFADIAQGYLSPCTKLMKKIKGPRYTLPVFQNIRPPVDETVVPTTEAHDIIELTQPSQHVPNVSVASSSRPQKLQTFSKMKVGKRDIKKDLSLAKRSVIYRDWGWGFGRMPLIARLSPLGCYIPENAMQSLAPGSWIDDRIIYIYMMLLRQREEDIHLEGVFERRPVYFFMDPLFMNFGLAHMKAIKEATKIGVTERNLAFDRAERNFTGYATSIVGPSIIEADYVFIPHCVEGVHWVLFVFSMKTFEVLLLDSLNDSPPACYKRPTKVLTWLFPKLFERIHPNHGVEFDVVPCNVVPNRPKQYNSDDCGVFVMKYMDFMLQGYDMTSLQPWSQDLVDNFRYRIAWELQKGKARKISDLHMRNRLQLD